VLKGPDLIDELDLMYLKCQNTQDEFAFNRILSRNVILSRLFSWSAVEYRQSSLLNSSGI
jgi:hypothetical protein